MTLDENLDQFIRPNDFNDD